MAGFAINLKLILDNPDAMFSFEVPRGYQESTILGAVITKEELEPKADMCSKVSLNFITFKFLFAINRRLLSDSGVRMAYEDWEPQIEQNGHRVTE